MTRSPNGPANNPDASVGFGASRIAKGTGAARNAGTAQGADRNAGANQGAAQGTARGIAKDVRGAKDASEDAPASKAGFISDLARYYGIKPMVELFGLGLAFCWYYSSQRLVSNGYDGMFQVVQYIANSLGCLAVCLAASRLKRNVTRLRPVIVAGLALTVVSAPFIVVDGPWASSAPIMMTLAAVSGLILSWLCCMWGQLFARLETKQAFACICGTLVLSSFVKIFYDLLGHDAASALALLALPFASLAFWHGAWSQYGEAPEGKGGTKDVDFTADNVSALKSTCVGVSLIALGSGVFMSLVSGVFELPLVWRLAAQGATIVLALSALLLARRASEVVSPFVMWFGIVLVIASGLALGILTGAPLGGLSSSIFTVAQMCVISFWYVALADIAHRGNMPSDCVFGLGWGAFFALPMGLGILLPHLSPDRIDVQSMAVVVIWILMLALVFLRQHQAPRLRLFIDFDPHIDDHQSVDLDERLADLTKDFGLTPREREVVGLYARGRTRAVIGDQLCVSENTVRDHIKSAYRKMGVHEKQELIDLLEAKPATGASSGQ